MRSNDQKTGTFSKICAVTRNHDRRTPASDKNRHAKEKAAASVMTTRRPEGAGCQGTMTVTGREAGPNPVPLPARTVTMY